MRLVDLQELSESRSGRPEQKPDAHADRGTHPDEHRQALSGRSPVPVLARPRDRVRRDVGDPEIDEREHAGRQEETGEHDEPELGDTPRLDDDRDDEQPQQSDEPEDEPRYDRVVNQAYEHDFTRR